MVKNQFSQNIYKGFLSKYRNSMTVRPTLCNKKVKTFLEVKDLCLFMGAAMTVAVCNCKTRKWILGPET